MDALILVFAIILSLVIGATVVLRNPRSQTHVLLFSFTILTSIGSLLNYFAATEDIQRISYVSLSLLVPQAACFYFLILLFPDSRLALKKYQYVLTSIPVIGGVGSAFLPLTITQMVIINLFLCSGFIVTAFRVFLQKYHRSEGIDRAQYKLIGIGIITSILLITLIHILYLYRLPSGSYISLSPFYTFPFIAAVAYSIIKHRLLDVQLILIRTVTYVGVVILSSVLYALILMGLGKLLVGTNLSFEQIVSFSLLSAIGAMTFPYLRQGIELFTDRYLYKKGYRTDIILSEIGKLLTSSLRIEFLARGLIKKLRTTMKVSKIAVVILSGGNLAEQFSEGFHPESFSNDFKSQLYSHHGNVIFDELEEGNLKLLMRNEGVSLIIPMRTEGGTVGVLILGPKETGDIYSDQDIDMLSIIAPEAAVTFQNALAYEEIRTFNVRLQEEIDKATQDLKNANGQLKELDKLKDEFVSLASHELRTPMTAIRGSLSTILEGYAGDISLQVREFLTAAYNENDRLIRLVNNLLNISRIEAGKLTFNIEPLSMDDIMMEVVGNLERAAKEKSLYLRYERKGDVPMIAGDSDKVREVLINLVGNAVKYTHKGGVTLKTEQQGDTVVTSVTDTGSGIAKEDQDLLFKKFSQVQGSYAKQSGGTGLGLYISKQIIEGLNGKIWLESTIGAGSTFYFSLPVYQRV